MTSRRREPVWPRPIERLPVIFTSALASVTVSWPLLTERLPLAEILTRSCILLFSTVEKDMKASRELGSLVQLVSVPTVIAAESTAYDLESGTPWKYCRNLICVMVPAIS